MPPGKLKSKSCRLRPNLRGLGCTSSSPRCRTPMQNDSSRVAWKLFFIPPGTLPSTKSRGGWPAFRRPSAYTERSMQINGLAAGNEPLGDRRGDFRRCRKDMAACHNRAATKPLNRILREETQAGRDAGIRKSKSLNPEIAISRAGLARSSDASRIALAAFHRGNLSFEIGGLKGSFPA
jgi:hypothetical protein